MIKMICLVAGLAFAGSAAALPAEGPFYIAAGGRCHDKHGFVMQSYCKGAVSHADKLHEKGKCHDGSGKFAKKALCHT